MNRINCDMRLKYLPATSTKPQRVALQQYEAGKWRTIARHRADVDIHALAHAMGCVIVDIQSPDFLYLAAKA